VNEGRKEAFVCILRYRPHILTHLLTPWCRILIEKLIVTQLDRWVHCHHGMARPQVADGGKSSGYGG
jgi:hypothetical protein